MEPVIPSLGNHLLSALGLSARQARLIPQVLLLPLTAHSWAFQLPEPFPVLWTSSGGIYSSQQSGKPMALPRV